MDHGRYSKQLPQSAGVFFRLLRCNFAGWLLGALQTDNNPAAIDDAAGSVPVIGQIFFSGGGIGKEYPAPHNSTASIFL